MFYQCECIYVDKYGEERRRTCVISKPSAQGTTIQMNGDKSNHEQATKFDIAPVATPAVSTPTKSIRRLYIEIINDVILLREMLSNNFFDNTGDDNEVLATTVIIEMDHNETLECTTTEINANIKWFKLLMPSIKVRQIKADIYIVLK